LVSSSVFRLVDGAPSPVRIRAGSSVRLQPLSILRWTLPRPFRFARNPGRRTARVRAPRCRPLGCAVGPTAPCPWTLPRPFRFARNLGRRTARVRAPRCTSGCRPLGCTVGADGSLPEASAAGGSPGTGPAA